MTMEMMKLLTICLLLGIAAIGGASAAPAKAPAPLNGVKILNDALAAVEKLGSYSKIIGYIKTQGAAPSIAAQLSNRKTRTLLLPTNAAFDAYVKNLRIITPTQAKDTIAIHILRGTITVKAALGYAKDTKIYTNAILPSKTGIQQFRITKIANIRGLPYFSFVSKDILGPNPFVLQKTLYSNGIITVVQVNQLLRWKKFLRS